MRLHRISKNVYTVILLLLIIDFFSYFTYLILIIHFIALTNCPLTFSMMKQTHKIENKVTGSEKFYAVDLNALIILNKSYISLEKKN